MMNKYLTYGFSLICASIVLIGCSELKEEKVPTQSVISVHGEGFTNPASENFHAVYIRSNNYDIQTCKTCHGPTYSGGTSGQSCNTCHSKPGGPENCTVCHGSVNAAPPKDLSDNSSPSSRSVGAHQKHLLGGIIGAPVACKECHAVPSQLLSAGHLDASLHAEVNFDSTTKFFRSNAQYISGSTNGTCSNTYCHGNFNGGNQNVTMTWSDTSASATACGTCHGDVTKSTLAEKAFPKSGHPEIGTAACVQCHAAVINANMAIINPSRHINGGID
jgi:predicted CxxxxCH...CXXCH cytochrome family protein